MKKNEKKLDNKLRNALMEVCEKAIDEDNGFKWLTHFVNFNNFPKSLIIVCVFDTNAALDSAKLNNQDGELIELIDSELQKAQFSIRDISQHIKFDTEENCDRQNYGRWNQRLNELVAH